MSIDERTRWLELFIERTGCYECFNNILGVLDFFSVAQIGQTGTWVSIVDAGILHGIAQGWGLYKGAISSANNWGAEPWKKFFDLYFQFPEGQKPYDRLRPLWAEGENQSTWYGVYVGLERGLVPSQKEAGLLAVTQVYREAVRRNDGSYGVASWYFDPFNPRARELILVSALTYWWGYDLLRGSGPFGPIPVDYSIP